MGNLAKRYGLDQAPPDPKLKGAAVMPDVALKTSPAASIASAKAERIEADRRVVSEAGFQIGETKPLDVAKIPVAKIKSDVAKIDGAANYATRRGRPKIPNRETEIRAAPRETEIKAAFETKILKRGRPSKPETEKPWIAAGVSRASWYRKAKEQA